jgi:hypothetical protein
MPDWLLYRPTIIGLAVVGGILSIVASSCQSRELLPEPAIGWLNKASYAFMMVSVTLFISAGLLGVDP